MKNTNAKRYATTGTRRELSNLSVQESRNEQGRFEKLIRQNSVSYESLEGNQDDDDDPSVLHYKNAVEDSWDHRRMTA